MNYEQSPYSLDGKLVTVFLLGSHEFTGVVEFTDADKIVLMGIDGSLVVYRDKISAAMIIDETKLEETTEGIIAEEYDDADEDAFIPDTTSESSYYGSVIPEDMLIGESNEPPISFSLNMSTMNNPQIKMNGGANDPDEEAELDDQEGAG